MKRTYHLKYNFQGTPMELTFETLTDFDKGLSKAMDEPGVLANSIDFYTTQPEPAPYPVVKRRPRVRYKPTCAPAKR